MTQVIAAFFLSPLTTISPLATMEKPRAVELLKKQIEASKELMKVKRGSPAWTKWLRDTDVAIRKIFGQEATHRRDFSDISYSLMAFSSDTPDNEFQKAYVRGLEQASHILESMIEEIEAFGLDNESKDHQSRITLSQILERFHLIARQLRKRYSTRPSLEVEDEYDVQDLLHALLRLAADDIRAEEWTPSYAGGSARMDFLLKKERVVIEVKKTRKGLSEKDIGDQLIIDVGRYQAHPDCAELICFIYDPEGRIANPAGLENDLTRQHDKLAVTVRITPRGN